MVNVELYEALKLQTTTFAGAARLLTSNAVIRRLTALQRRSGRPPSDEELVAIVAASINEGTGEPAKASAGAAVDYLAQARAEAGVEAEFGPYSPEAVSDIPADIVVSDAVEVSRSHFGGMDPEGLAAAAGGRAQRLVMQRADRTIVRNSMRDPAHPRWALVPNPGACAFCLMLGANGWTYRSKESALSSRHSGCRCTVVADYDVNNPHLDGYDPAGMQSLYADARSNVTDDAVRERWDAMTQAERDRYGKRRMDGLRRDMVVEEMERLRQERGVFQ